LPPVKALITHLVNPKTIQILESHVRFQLPKGGIHNPYVKTKKGKKCIYYKVLANRSPEKLAHPRWSSTFIVLKWTDSKGVYRPGRSFANALTSLSNEESTLVNSSGNGC
jgi:hypothetical protein